MCFEVCFLCLFVFAFSRVRVDRFVRVDVFYLLLFVCFLYVCVLLLFEFIVCFFDVCVFCVDDGCFVVFCVCVCVC